MRTTLTTIFITISLFSFAQNWALPSSSWTYAYAWMSPVSYFTISGVKDTTVDGIFCKKIGQSTPYYSYESNDTVFFFLNGQFRSTYYFNANVGDTVSFYNSTLLCSPRDTIVKAIITSIDSIVLSNQILKRFYPTTVLDSTGLTLSSQLSPYIEKIGGNYIYPYFYTNCTFDQEYYNICSYSDSTISNYYLSQNDSCLSTSVVDIYGNKVVKIYPNPTDNFITIDYNSIDWNKGEISLEITNELGQIVTQQHLPMYSGFQKIDITSFATGVYHVFIKRGLQIVAVSKFAKQ